MAESRVVLSVYTEGYPVVFGVFADEAGAMRAAVEEAESIFEGEELAFEWKPDDGDDYGQGTVGYVSVSGDAAEAFFLLQSFVVQS